MITFNNQLIYFLRKDYFSKLNKISREISSFKSDKESNHYQLELKPENQILLQNYEPLPTNRSRRSRLYAVKRSKVLKKIGPNSNSINVNDNQLSNKDAIRHRLISKKLLQ